MATLTYNPAEAQEGEFTEQEQENIKVGEALEEQQNQLLAGKFKDAEDLEKGYIELQKKLGEPKGETEEQQEVETVEDTKEDDKESEVDVTFLDKLWYESNDEFSQETLKELEGMKPQDLAQMHLEYRAKTQPTPLNDEAVNSLQGVAGGKEGYDTMIEWAQQNLQEQEIKMYDTVMDRGDPLACFFAVQALKNRFDDASGVDGEMLTGKAPVNKGDNFRSQAEVVRAMNDPKYENDPAYRQDVYNKLERSNLEF
jgi:hypothetical protein